jgi:hypothetical protein
MRSPVAELLAALGEAFDRLGVRWYLFGAQAAIVHGAARLTADVDVTVEPGPGGSREIVVALEACGFALRVRDAYDFVEKTRVLPLLHGASGLPVDIVLAGPGIEELFLDRVEHRSLEGVTVRVARAEDVVAMKILAGRPKDIEDATAILGAQGKRLDLALIRATLALLERALDQSDLLPRLEDLVERVLKQR